MLQKAFESLEYMEKKCEEVYKEDMYMYYIYEKMEDMSE